MEDYVHSEIQGLLLALDELGRSFGCNRDLYYTLGEYLGYTKAFLFSIEQSQTDPLAWILCSACTKAQKIASFVYDLEYYFYNYGHYDAFIDFYQSNWTFFNFKFQLLEIHSVNFYGKISGIILFACTFRRTFKECFFVLSYWTFFWLLRRGINAYTVILTF